MVFVRKSAGRSGATKVQIAERRNGRNHIIEHVGTARSEAELAVLMAEARRRLRPGQEALDLELDEEHGGQSSRSGVITGKQSALLWRVLASVYQRLGFDVVADEAFQELVLARIIEPTSKADSLRVLDEVGVAHASLRTMFRALGRAQQRDYRSQIAAACFTHAASSGDVSLCLYDVTTLYFEAEHEDDLRKVGYSKERRVDPQVVVGLLVDRGGFPLEIGCWEGNKAETSTILPIVEAFQARHGISDMVVVADAGMLSTANLTALDEAGLRFIVGSRAVKAPGDLASHFRWHGDAFTDGQLIDTITAKKATAAARAENDTAKRAEPIWDPAQHPGSWRAVWAYSKKRAVRDRTTLTLQENRTKAVIAGEKASRTPPVRQDHRWRPSPGRGLPPTGSPAGRLEGIRDQHPRHGDGRRGGRRQLSRAVAGRSILPDEQDRPTGPADLPPHPRSHRSAPDHRLHRPRGRPLPARRHRDEHQEDHPGTTPDPADPRTHRRP